MDKCLVNFATIMTVGTMRPERLRGNCTSTKMASGSIATATVSDAIIIQIIQRASTVSLEQSSDAQSGRQWEQECLQPQVKSFT